MSSVEIPVLKVHPSARLPERAFAGDAGFDLYATANLEIAPQDSALIPTGIAIELPPGFEAQVRPRSGLALRHQVTVLNSPGTIDAGFRGEICVILINHGRDTFAVRAGMKIAQLVVNRLPDVLWVETETLGESPRGSGGFGSSGV